MNLYVIGQQHIDRAWAAGASSLAKAFDRYSDECTVDQMRMRLARGEATLLTLVEDSQHVAWIAVEFIQYPNLRALHVAALYAPNALTDEAQQLVEQYGLQQGASVIQAAASGAAQRLYEHKCGYSPAYTILRRPICQVAAEATAM